jgi:hypothetical protein
MLYLEVFLASHSTIVNPSILDGTEQTPMGKSANATQGHIGMIPMAFRWCEKIKLEGYDTSFMVEVKTRNINAGSRISPEKAQG